MTNLKPHLRILVDRIISLICDTRGEVQYKSDVPKHEIDSIIRTFFPSVIAFFESEDGRREFAEWKSKQEKEKKIKQSA